MARLIVTVSGDDRDRLIATLSGIVTSHGANWEESRIAELAGRFAGVIVLAADDAAVPELSAALRAATAGLEVTIHPATDVSQPVAAQQLTIHVLGNDRPGIVHEVSDVLARTGLSIERMRTEWNDAPMAGGRLFEAGITGTVPPSFDQAQVRAGLERLATEIQVDIELTAADGSQADA